VPIADENPPRRYPRFGGFTVYPHPKFHRDFIWVYSSEGFHQWKEANRVLEKAEDPIEEGMEILETV
jgi:hypothetical protein